MRRESAEKQRLREKRSALLPNPTAATAQHEVELSEVDGGMFHRWLTLARLVAVSEGAAVISVQHWRHMRELEVRRASRRGKDS